MSWNNWKDISASALMASLVFGAGAIAHAEEADPADKNVVKIGRSDKALQSNLGAPEVGTDDDEGRPIAAPKYWIGLLGGAIPADHPLRAQIELPENQGLLVANIVSKSPADKAGLKQYDILMKGNGKDLPEMKDLIDLVMSEGDKKGQIVLDVLRRGKHETVNLKPEGRPADAEMQPGDSGGGGIGGNFGQPGQMMPGAQPGQPGQPGMPRPGMFSFRNFGSPGVVMGADPFAGMPNGVSIRVDKKKDQPTHIVVQRGDDKWDITGDDADSLKKLPDDLRPTVERMLHGGGGGFGGAMMGGGNPMMPNLAPHQGPGFGPGMGPGGRPGMGPDMDAQLREQLERMEKRIDEMQRRMHGQDNRPANRADDGDGSSK